MKKNLLMIAAMFAAVSASAQGAWTNTTGEAEKEAVVYAAGTQSTDLIPGMTITFAGATDWAAKGIDAATFTGVDGVEYSKNYIQGNTNGMAGGLEHSSGQSSHVQFTVNTAGTVYIAAKFGNNKPIWAAKVATSAMEDLDDSDMTAYLYTYEGKYIKDDGTYGGDEAATDAVYSALPLAVEPNYTYFFWVSGSKLMLSGINFVSGGSAVAGIAEAKAEAAAPVKVITANGVQIGNFNIAGQQVK